MELMVRRARWDRKRWKQVEGREGGRGGKGWIGKRYGGGRAGWD